MLALLLVAACSPAEPVSVVLLGDSITSGVASEPAGPGYAALLADALGSGYALRNVACAGTTSIDWSPSVGNGVCGPDRVAPSMYAARARTALPADLVVILLGTNDASGFLEPEAVTPQRYHEALAELVRALQADGAARVMLMTPPQFYQGSVRRLAHYRDEVLELCSPPADSILCGPDVYSLLTAEDFAFNDPHPNAVGHRKIATALRDAIVAALPAR